MSMRLILLAVAGLAILTGCSTTGLGSNTFECGEGKDVNCASVMEAYRNSDGIGPKTAPKKAIEMVSTVPAMGAAIDDAQWPKPVLEPAQVMRIWVAPWRDANDTLHWPSYMFTEVRPRKWSFGQPDFRGAKPLVPLQVLRRDPAHETSEPTPQATQQSKTK